MIRAALLAALVLTAAPAFAQQVDGGAPPPAPKAGASNEDLEQLRRDLLEQARKEADQRVAQAKEEMRNEVRAELATQSANRSWEEEWQEQKKKLDLLELDGYLRMRPTLLHDMDLSRGQDPTGQFLSPRPYVNSGQDPSNGNWPARSQAWADMRFRLEPTINVSEDIRLHAQLDILDDLVMGSSPEVDGYYPTPFFSMSQLSPSNALRVKRAYAEVNTPVGLLSFGRMGSNWGLGMFTNDGNCLDCDYGDTVDRISFAARIAGYYVVPMFDYVGEGPFAQTRTDQGTSVGQPVDLEQADDVSGPLSGPVFTLAVAKRDTDKELQRKLDAGESSFNYGLYFSYRRQSYAYAQDANRNPVGLNFSASMYTPDLWARFQTPRLRLEAEVAGIFGSIDNHNLNPSRVNDLTATQSLTMTQLGAVVQGEYKALENMKLHLTGEVGFASGDSAPGFGNTNTLGTNPTVKGQIDGPQFNCTSINCSDASIDNFRFNRDYRVDEILWRQILGSVTDAVYVKPGVRYDIAEGFDVHLNMIYSRAVFTSSTPGNNPNLGVEFDPGLSYRSDDGFIANLNYGLLVPLAGLRNNCDQFTPPGASTPTSYCSTNLGQTSISPSLAHAIRATFAVKF